MIAEFTGNPQGPTWQSWVFCTNDAINAFYPSLEPAAHFYIIWGLLDPTVQCKAEQTSVTNWATLAKFIEENYPNERWIEALDKLRTKGNLFKNLTPEAATTRACDFMHEVGASAFWAVTLVKEYLHHFAANLQHAPPSLGNTDDLAAIDLEPRLHEIAAAIKASRAFATILGTTQHPNQPVQAAPAVSKPQAGQIKPRPTYAPPLPSSRVPQVESNSSNARRRRQLESLRLKNKELQAKLDALTQSGKA
ncbi:hypothetical protein IWQ60_006853 [Tieghemiomyces parasiticus]|uniref:Uncharacterized protein n=1 Tax=Tieghemiomyces parasiticus TaxID=78921 RepID=A0A9W8A4L6_9FUNG|nr:hypothetical protein IWQ60_006853 [Tieghemiomyces parasiticus]